MWRGTLRSPSLNSHQSCPRHLQMHLWIIYRLNGHLWLPRHQTPSSSFTEQSSISSKHLSPLQMHLWIVYQLNSHLWSLRYQTPPPKHFLSLTNHQLRYVPPLLNMSVQTSSLNNGSTMVVTPASSCTCTPDLASVPNSSRKVTPFTKPSLSTGAAIQGKENGTHTKKSISLSSTERVLTNITEFLNLSATPKLRAKNPMDHVFLLVQKPLL